MLIFLVHPVSWLKRLHEIRYLKSYLLIKLINFEFCELDIFLKIANSKETCNIYQGFFVYVFLLKKSNNLYLVH